ncbi:MAG: hypothetical protein NVS4B9_41830 [Ktedonobacteraceae bacterium]
MDTNSLEMMSQRLSIKPLTERGTMISLLTPGQAGRTANVLLR